MVILLRFLFPLQQKRNFRSPKQQLDSTHSNHREGAQLQGLWFPTFGSAPTFAPTKNENEKWDKTINGYPVTLKLTVNRTFKTLGVGSDEFPSPFWSFGASFFWLPKVYHVFWGNSQINYKTIIPKNLNLSGILGGMPPLLSLHLRVTLQPAVVDRSVCAAQRCYMN